MHSKRGLEMKNNSETIGKVAVAVAYTLLAYAAVRVVIEVINDYKLYSWPGVINDLAIAGLGVLAYFAARRFSGKQSLVAFSAALRVLLMRLYTMLAYLPEGKYPVTLREMSDEEVVFYARRVITNSQYWSEVPEKITIFARSYVTKPYIMAEHEPFETKDVIERLITDAIVFAADGISFPKRKKQNRSSPT
jgi:hypothetical protein